MNPVKDFVFGALLPTAASCALFLLSWRLLRRAGADRANVWGGPLAVAAAYVMAHAYVFGWPPRPPGDVAEWHLYPVNNWLFYIALAAAAAGLVESWRRVRLWMVWVVRLVLLAVVLALLLTPLVRNVWSVREAALWLSVVAVAFAGMWLAIDVASFRQRGAVLPAVLFVVIGTCGGVMLAGHSASMAQLSGGLAAAPAGAMLAALWCRDLTLADGAASTITVVYAGIVVNGYFYVEIPPLAAAMLVLAFMAPAVLAVPVVSRRPGWQRLSFVLALVAVPLLLALIVTLRRPDPYAYY